MITRYSFGIMEIDGEIYRKDLIVLPDGSIHHPWRRAAGHELTLADIQPILEAEPAFLVVGTGGSGMLQPDAEFIARLEAEGVQVIVLPTDQAVHEFDKLSAQAGDCAGCFHLTC